MPETNARVIALTALVLTAAMLSPECGRVRKDLSAERQLLAATSVLFEKSEAVHPLRRVQLLMEMYAAHRITEYNHIGEPLDTHGDVVPYHKRLEWVESYNTTSTPQNAVSQADLLN
jgi:hypothetical protein